MSLPEASRWSAGDIPLDVIEALARYRDLGLRPGGFLEACLENNLTQAFARGDETRLAHLRDIVAWMFYRLPAAAWGSEERVTEWIQHRGDAGWKVALGGEGATENEKGPR